MHVPFLHLVLLSARAPLQIPVEGDPKSENGELESDHKLRGRKKLSISGPTINRNADSLLPPTCRNSAEFCKIYLKFDPCSRRMRSECATNTTPQPFDVQSQESENTLGPARPPRTDRTMHQTADEISSDRTLIVLSTTLQVATP
jgi:hypothetical protein